MERESVHRHLQINSNFEYEKDSFRNPLRKNIYHKSFNLRIIKGYKKEEIFGSKSRVKWLKEETRIQYLSIGHVTPRFWPMVLKMYMMYILYLNHGEELKTKDLPLIWCFMYRRSRLMPMVIVLSQAHNILKSSWKYTI